MLEEAGRVFDRTHRAYNPTHFTEVRARLTEDGRLVRGMAAAAADGAPVLLLLAADDG